MQAAADHLVAVDPAFGPIVATSPLCTLGRTDNQPDTHFASLVKSVIAQQLSTKVADTLTARLTAALEGDVSPTKVLALDEEAMRAAGLSRAKTRTIKGLATAMHSGDLDIDAALAHDDEHRLRSELTALWGIGRWTAEMFEMFTLHRLDVWPVGDLAMRRGWAQLHGLAGDPGARAMDPWGEPLRPYRSVAAWYCWRVVDGDNPSW
ncbi:MAG: DNA-3-methyladenine glycosylase [Actinomycetota bacterium]|nr:DNA-3-methyladenine glycosylase [Actinomycetota bacterium]